MLINNLPGNKAIVPLYVKDFAGKTSLYLTQYNSTSIQNKIQLIIPIDNDNDGIADVWERNNGLDTNTDDSSLDNDSIPVGREYLEHDNKGIVPKTWVGGVPGDYLTNFDEYRGFFAIKKIEKDGNVANVEYSHRRTDPNRKDIFVWDALEKLSYRAKAGIGLLHQLSISNYASPINNEYNANGYNTNKYGVHLILDDPKTQIFTINMELAPFVFSVPTSISECVESIGTGDSSSPNPDYNSSECKENAKSWGKPHPTIKDPLPVVNFNNIPDETKPTDLDKYAVALKVKQGTFNGNREWQAPFLASNDLSPLRYYKENEDDAWLNSNKSFRIALGLDDGCGNNNEDQFYVGPRLNHQIWLSYTPSPSSPTLDITPTYHFLVGHALGHAIGMGGKHNYINDEGCASNIESIMNSGGNPGGLMGDGNVNVPTYLPTDLERIMIKIGYEHKSQ